MQYFKAAVSGAVAALAMFIVIAVLIQTGNAPFNLPPSQAFLDRIGLPPQPLGLIVHFGYGIVWSIILVAIMGRQVRIRHGIGLSLLLWLIMMVVYSPVIGWGFFGFAAPAHEFPADHPRHLGSSIMYLVGALVLHLIYGLTMGWINAKWIGSAEPAAARPMPSQTQGEQERHEGTPAHSQSS